VILNPVAYLVKESQVLRDAASGCFRNMNEYTAVLWLIIVLFSWLAYLDREFGKLLQAWQAVQRHLSYCLLEGINKSFKFFVNSIPELQIPRDNNLLGARDFCGLNQRIKKVCIRPAHAFYRE
jgi:hypothetical protein